MRQYRVKWAARGGGQIPGTKKPPFGGFLFARYLMVPKAGLEPARISTVDFESTASTDFATSALK